MTIETILTCILSDETAERLTEIAATLTRAHDAHLIGQHTFEAIVVYPGIAMHLAAPSYAVFNDTQQKQAEAIEATFRAVTERHGIKAEWRAVDAGTALASDRMIESARAADLVVMLRPEQDDDRTDQRFALDQVLRDSGRPVLVVPDDASVPAIGNCAVIAHSGTKESARAAFDLLPLLQPGAKVHLIHVGDARDEMRDGAMTELSATIARHGFDVTMAHRASHGKTVSETLIQTAQEVGADVIAAGAYGHSRTYAFFIGATTGDLIRKSPIPVLFSG